jgi:hypothetical protein
MRYVLTLFYTALIGLMVGSVLAQPQTPTPGPIDFGPVTAVTATPGASPTPAPTPLDARPSICAAPYQPGFEPYQVRPGDRLPDLLIGLDAFSLTQIAALNCLDDPATLPVGGVIWLPRVQKLIRADPFDADPTVDDARILRLEASAATIANQAGVFFTWETRGSAAYFYVCPPEPEATCQRPVEAQPVPPGYSTPVIAGFQFAGPVRYRLEVVDGAARAVQDITVQVECSQTALGDFSGTRQPCPLDPPRYVEGAWQPFERGYLLWWAEARTIWALTRADGRLRVLPDAWQEGTPEPIYQPPNGLSAPVRGFGEVWRTLGGAEGALGWAVAPEAGTSFGTQAAGRVSYTTFLVGLEPGQVYAVTLLPGESTGWWAAVP